MTANVSLNQSPRVNHLLFVYGRDFRDSQTDAMKLQCYFRCGIFLISLLDRLLMKIGKKIVLKHIHIRAPENYYHELQKIAESSGLSINSLCLELLREGIKTRLKELKLK